MIVTSLESGQFARLLALCGALVGGLIEKDRRPFELEENENHHPGEENEELHRQFEHGIEEQPEAAGGERTAGEIALHLRLVGPEIGEREKEAAEQTRPKSVAMMKIEREIDRVSFPIFPAMETAWRNDTSGRQTMENHAEGDAHPGEDDGHLPLLRVADGGCSAGGRIDDDKKPESRIVRRTFQPSSAERMIAGA